MKISETAKQVIETGISPIALSFFAERGFQEDEKIILRSVLLIQSLELGTLSPLEYRFVARRTKQGDALVEKHIQKLFSGYKYILKNHKNTECITLPVFPRVLRENKLSAMLFDGLTKNLKINPSKICVEFSSDILFEDSQEIKKQIDAVRGMGIKIAISEVGDDFCPLTRLSALKPDYVFADSLDSEKLKTEEALNLVKYLKISDTKVFSPMISDQAQIDLSEEMGFDGYLDPAPINIEGVGI